MFGGKMSTSKPDCIYGTSCYRRNPAHFSQFSHPPEVVARLSASSSSHPTGVDDRETDHSSAKRIKTNEYADRGAASWTVDRVLDKNPIGFFLARVTELGQQLNSILSNPPSIDVEDI